MTKSSLKAKLQKDIQDSKLRMKYASSIKRGLETIDKEAAILPFLREGLKAGYGKAYNALQGLDTAIGKKLWNIAPTREGLKRFFSYHNVQYPLDELGKEVVEAIPGTVERVPSALGGLRNLSLAAGGIVAGDKLVDMITKKSKEKNDLSAFAPSRPPGLARIYIDPIGSALRGNAPTRSYNANVVITLEKLRLSDPDRYDAVVSAMPSEAFEQYQNVRNSMLGK